MSVDGTLMLERDLFNRHVNLASVGIRAKRQKAEDRGGRVVSTHIDGLDQSSHARTAGMR